MMRPAAAKAVSKRSLRRDGEKQGRASDGSRAVRVFNENDFLVACLHPSHDAERIRRLLAAPNAVAVRKHGDKLVAIRLQSFGDDRGHPGGRYGRSTVATERVRNDDGRYVGTHNNLKHKEAVCETWGNLAVRVRAETAAERKCAEVPTGGRGRSAVVPDQQLN
jgi:hypothetical protein